MLSAAALLALALAQAQPEASPPAPEPPAAPVPAPAVPPPAPQRAPVPSLLSAEPLRGASMFSLAAGWPRLRLAYAQGIGHTTDLGGFAEFDYATTEFRAGLSYRGQVIPKAPPFDGALRLWLAWYHDSGGQWFYSKNHPDEGFEIGAGVSYSRAGGGGIVSLTGDVPITITLRKDGGALLSPRAAFAYETPLYGPFTVGLQLGLGLRFGVGNAPIKEGTAELTVLGLASYRLP